jgi:carbon-monoxide dehydrogenase iron sulfur subunit
MKRVYVNEQWCLGCKLCEYNCAFANMDATDMADALKNVKINPRIRIEDNGETSFAVSCRHCKDPLCVKSCITGAFSVKDGLVCIDSSKCVKCYTCIMVCPYGSVTLDGTGVIQKCELCVKNHAGEPACVKGCPTKLLYTRRGNSRRLTI